MPTRPFTTAVLCVLLGGTAPAAELHPGVWLERDLGGIPLPAGRHEVYLIGELHGVQEMGEALLHYLARLHKEAGVRDVALEEDAVHGRAAQDYVSGLADELPEPLCLRAAILRGLREFNRTRAGTEAVRVHLVDIDSPEPAIRQHLVSIRERIPGAGAVTIPDASAVASEGLAAAEELARRTGTAPLLGELRTVRRSILALQQGFRVATGGLQGSPYLEEREAAIADNMRDIVAAHGPLLAFYGANHVSKTPRDDGGPARTQPFDPAALRLAQAGLDVFSLVVFPLSGHSRWRGASGELPWTAADGRLPGGETLDRVLASDPAARWLYVDPRRQRVEIPSREISRYAVDGFLLPAAGTALESECPPR